MNSQPLDGIAWAFAIKEVGVVSGPTTKGSEREDVQTHREERTVSDDGKLLLEEIPFEAGTRVEVIVRECESEASMVDDLFTQAEEAMRRSFSGWEQDLSPDEGEKGGIRERRVADFLSRVLPQRFGIGTGHIIDARQEKSHQTDIVIYDAIDGVALPVDDYYSLFPCESVYAAIEVKSTLSGSQGNTIHKCVENTHALRLLDRQRYGLPLIFSVVFAYRTTSDWAAQKRYIKTMEWFCHFCKDQDNQDDPTMWPDMIVVLDPGFVLTPLSPSGRHYQGIEKWQVTFRRPLLLFVSRLLHFLTDPARGAKVGTPNLFNDYSGFSRLKIGEITLSDLGSPVKTE